MRTGRWRTCEADPGLSESLVSEHCQSLRVMRDARACCVARVSVRSVYFQGASDQDSAAWESVDSLLRAECNGRRDPTRDQSSDGGLGSCLRPVTHCARSCGSSRGSSMTLRRP
eukprot:655989-Rhodomonas_salina.1